MRLGLTSFIVLAMVVGTAVGLVFHAFVHDQAALALIAGGCDLVSTIFLRAIKMIIAPLVFATLVTGVAKMGGSGAVGRVATRSMIWFIVASVAAILVSLAFVDLLGPGRGLSLKAAGPDVGLKAPPLTAASISAQKAARAT